MKFHANDVEPHVYLVQQNIEQPSEAELKLILQFMPEIYQDMLDCLTEKQE